MKSTFNEKNIKVKYKKRHHKMPFFIYYIILNDDEKCNNNYSYTYVYHRHALTILKIIISFPLKMHVQQPILQ